MKAGGREDWPIKICGDEKCIPIKNTKNRINCRKKTILDIKFFANAALGLEG